MHRNLVKISDSAGKNEAWYCNSCSSEFNPDLEKLRNKSKLITPYGQDTNTIVNTPVARTPGPVSQFEHKPVEPKGVFKQLQQRGMKIKDYKETDGAGRTISWE